MGNRMVSKLNLLPTVIGLGSLDDFKIMEAAL
jgi:hypothetical protein